jgi:hypothetical protein
MLQLNITIFLLVILILGVLIICSRSSNLTLLYGGATVALVSCVALVIFVTLFYLKQQSRPLDGQTAAISLKDESGREFSIENPPDSVFHQGELRALARSILVGYDENLCADGEVIGKASEGKFRLYSTEEKAAFKKQHREEIRGKRAQAAQLLRSNLAETRSGPETELFEMEGIINPKATDKPDKE